MYVRGKDTPRDRAIRNIESMSLREQREYYQRTKSWLSFYVTCWKLGELSDKEVLRFKQRAMKGNI